MKKFFLGVAVFFFFVMQNALATNVKSIYQAEIPVASQSSQDRSAAVQKGLAQVLVKVSGKASVLENPGLKSHLNSADTLVQEFSYLQQPTGASLPYLLQIRFDSEGVNTLLRDASAPLWGQNRSLILAWIELEVPGRVAEIIDNESHSDIQTLLKQHAKRRGLPIILPVMDVADLNQVNVNHIVTMEEPVLLNASKRYNSDGILILRIFQETNGFSLQSKLILGNEKWGWNVNGKKLEDVLAALVDNIAETFAGRFAIVVTNNVQSKLTLKVRNIKSEEDFVQLGDYLKRLTPVADVELINLVGDEAEFSLRLQGSKNSFIQALGPGQHLIAVPDAQSDALIYQWNP